MSDTFLVVGLGSMGKRRVRDLKALGAGRVIGVDRREDRRQDVGHRFGVETMDDFDRALETAPKAVIVSVPPHLHHRICTRALDARAAYFVECLTCLTLDEMDDLVARERVRPGRAFPSCSHLMFQSTQLAQEHLTRAGKLFGVQLVKTSWLPNQHPWEKQVGDHYEFHRAQGGGLAEPSYILSWVLPLIRQRPVSVIAHADHVSNLPQGFNDLLDMIIRLDGGAVINFRYALNERHDGGHLGDFARFASERGTVLTHWDNERFYDADAKKWTEFQLPADWSYENVYLAEMKHFLAALEGREKYFGDLRLERDILATLLAAEESSRRGCRVDIAFA